MHLNSRYLGPEENQQKVVNILYYANKNQLSSSEGGLADLYDSVYLQYLVPYNTIPDYNTVEVMVNSNRLQKHLEKLHPYFVGLKKKNLKRLDIVYRKYAEYYSIYDLNKTILEFNIQSVSIVSGIRSEVEKLDISLIQFTTLKYLKIEPDVSLTLQEYNCVIYSNPQLETFHYIMSKSNPYLYFDIITVFTDALIEHASLTDVNLLMGKQGSNYFGETNANLSNYLCRNTVVKKLTYEIASIPGICNPIINNTLKSLVAKNLNWEETCYPLSLWKSVSGIKSVDCNFQYNQILDTIQFHCNLQHLEAGFIRNQDDISNLIQIINELPTLTHLKIDITDVYRINLLRLTEALCNSKSLKYLQLIGFSGSYQIELFNQLSISKTSLEELESLSVGESTLPPLLSIKSIKRLSLTGPINNIALILNNQNIEFLKLNSTLASSNGLTIAIKNYYTTTSNPHLHPDKLICSTKSGLVDIWSLFKKVSMSK
ncbi:hypothetical protein DLAC_06410 [Tieghemostelium lacteum]|uniref:Uncharacterized protein n=1 Tax=Tieghemostelium lacteum TaxID=361077 RepID=A0A151ZEQ1_TIELA|nr:hypothetical protein DLAC_06410 [Tieghemostelium lacteum]|eukprot:KYQ92431.1 hypothetical protein DLAC_06410 [Tieghemostelium lacteum]